MAIAARAATCGRGGPARENGGLLLLLQLLSLIQRSHRPSSAHDDTPLQTFERIVMGVWSSAPTHCNELGMAGCAVTRPIRWESLFFFSSFLHAAGPPCDDARKRGSGRTIDGDDISLLRRLVRLTGVQRDGAVDCQAQDRQIAISRRRLQHDPCSSRSWNQPWCRINGRSAMLKPFAELVLSGSR